MSSAKTSRIAGYSLLFWLSILVVRECPTSAEVHNSKNKVRSLPGLEKLNANMYTGFVRVDEDTDTNLFYMLVEAKENPHEKPLVWFMNGGPGASSFAALFAEQGPYLLNNNMSLIENPYSWNSIANVLYVEFAAGIGYSYRKSSMMAHHLAHNHRDRVRHAIPPTPLSPSKI